MCSCLHRIFSCCTKQLKCLLCGSSCACCCSFCPSINESTSTRLMYSLILFIVTLLCALSMSPYAFNDLVDIPNDIANSTCEDFQFGSNCFIFAGAITVYRLSFATILFFFILMIFTIGIKTSKSYRAYVHNGFWFWKFALLIFLIIMSFKMPFNIIFRELWMYIGMVAATSYIIINMLLLIELAYSWTEKMLNREACRLLWCLTLILLILFFITVSVILTIYLYINFAPTEECVYNNIFIGIMSTSCFVFFLFAILVAAKTKKTYTYLLPTSFLSAYVLLLTWSALTSIPRLDLKQNSFNQTLNDTSKWCYTNKSIVQIDQRFIAYLSVLISILLSIYSSLKTSSHSKNLGIEVRNVAQKEICFGCCIKKQKRRIEKVKGVNGQTLIRNEINGVEYSYSFFHFIFMLAVFHNMMQLTNWNRPDIANLDTFGQSMPTVYMKAASAMLCIFIFGATLFASCCCPKKHLPVPGNDTSL